MFWRFGGYNVSTIDTILEKESFQLEELLDESDLIQELKQHNPKLVEYLRDQQILEKLLQYVVAPKLEPVAIPDDDEEEEQEDDELGKPPVFPTTRSRSSSRATEPSGQEENEKKRNRYAYVAAEILSSDNYSIHEALMESKPLLRNFWEFLKRPTPLDPLQASYFTKVNESLFDKKTEEMLDLLKSFQGAIADILRHVDCPMIMDLLLKIISLERTESGQGVVEWLYTQNVMPTLLSFLGPEHSWATQTSAADFIKAIITVSANASQNEQTCIGPNELTRQLVSRSCVEQLIQYMLGGGNPLTCGVGIIIEVIRKNNSDYDPEGVDANAPPSCRDPIYLGTLLRLFADHVPDFMRLIMNSTAQKERLASTFGDKIEPLGFDRFKTCELMAELLHCSNMGLLNEVGSEQFIAARDAQRQRLRDEGRLIPARGVDDTPSSTEDLTMRTSQSSPAEERRKLEVMNISADDDGFEEVSHDTSDDVLELPDAPTQAPTFSMLEKDDADFVDEPLSSPRLNFKELDTEKRAESPPAFDDPDLVVAPLSPTKKAVQLGLTDNQPNVSKPVTDEKEPQTSDKSREISTAELPALSTEPSIPRAPEADDTLSPHPGDRPAPLFSGSATQKPAADATATVGESTEKTEKTSETSPTKAEAAEGASANANANETTGEISIIIAPVSDSATPTEGASTAPQPVVGDYLKMQFVRQEVVPTILRFFFKYPWNNFLHNVVYDIVQQVFNGPMDRGFNPTLAISLFEAADITNQIINGQLASEKSQSQHKTRMGYMGHLTLIAEEVVKFTERHPPELLSEVVLEKVMAQDWINYVEGALAETRERDNAILGGVRPEVAMSNRAAQSSLVGVGLNGLSSIGLGGSNSNALAEAGLGGGSDLGDGSGAGASPFGISSGTMMSGFGSSSDEDEDEEQETEEDVNNEFRAYTDPLNANSSNSLNPPSIPPPPPPPPPLNLLNPTRARMQLTAQLAKRNAAAAAENGGQEGSASNTDDGASDAFTLPSLTTSERLRNPFADDEDDEDNSSDEDNLDNADGEGGGGSSAWERGSWWRNVVGGRSSTRRQGDNETQEKERFGDGRDDSDDSDDRVNEEDMDDEEFGDFAMPEVQSSGAMVSGIDPAREKILVKPMALHPSAAKSSFGSLWPFGGQGFGANKDKEKEQEKKTEVDQGASSSSSANAITEEPVELGKEEDEGVIGEDGQKINRAVEAKRRTSIEEPDDDDVGGEEIIVHKGPGVH
ncbi:SIT4 phosphatase-associated protein-domain-containing protein [Cercophora samala]|uniref:SIT4 phosphatase-associated protein-domain-containing protein n=1 Tax=Cercophora samala TaxID=330535 RepID=A0AA40DDN6_9PEZI|nr:SIT4 phosphatase-associated protein-domain-containing protein [Cercophora samala]